MFTLLQTPLSRQELSTNLGRLLETNLCFTTTDSLELKLATISADLIKKKISFTQVEIKADYFFFYNK